MYSKKREGKGRMYEYRSIDRSLINYLPHRWRNNESPLPSNIHPYFIHPRYSLHNMISFTDSSLYIINHVYITFDAFGKTIDHLLITYLFSTK